MKCPRCHSENTKITTSRAGDYNKLSKDFDMSEVPSYIQTLDYRLRRYKCNACGYRFPTIETYYKSKDVLSYMDYDNPYA